MKTRKTIVSKILDYLISINKYVTAHEIATEIESNETDVRRKCQELLELRVLKFKNRHSKKNKKQIIMIYSFSKKLNVNKMTALDRHFFWEAIGKHPEIARYYQEKDIRKIASVIEELDKEIISKFNNKENILL